MSDFFLDILPAVLTLLGVFVTSGVTFLIARGSNKTTQRLNSTSELQDIIKLKNVDIKDLRAEIANLENDVDALNIKIYKMREYINVLSEHIYNKKGPPVPPFPDDIINMRRSKDNASNENGGSDD